MNTNTIIHKNENHHLEAHCKDGKTTICYTDRGWFFEAQCEQHENDAIFFWKDDGYWNAWSVKTNRCGNNVSLTRLLTDPKFGQPLAC